MFKQAKLQPPGCTLLLVSAHDVCRPLDTSERKNGQCSVNQWNNEKSKWFSYDLIWWSIIKFKIFLTMRFALLTMTEAVGLFEDAISNPRIAIRPAKLLKPFCLDKDLLFQVRQYSTVSTCNVICLAKDDQDNSPWWRCNRQGDQPCKKFRMRLASTRYWRQFASLKIFLATDKY